MARIDLGLSRIRQLLVGNEHKWKAVHVAGTNGKGSVCSYISSMLHSSNVRWGRFTSPHLIDRWDCINVNGVPVTKRSFDDAEQKIKSLNEKNQIGATNFEVLTAAAFDIFSQRDVKIAVVEVGVGGRSDATNVIQSPLACVITKVGLDHQGLLGNTLEEIAYEKAGIMKPGVPCFIDATNTLSAQKVFEDCAKSVGAGKVQLVHPDSKQYEDDLWRALDRKQFEDHQQMNIALAFEAAKSALEVRGESFDPIKLAQSVRSTEWPGRLQRIDLTPLVMRSGDTILDGAHNPQAAETLSRFVEEKLRQNSCPITWLLAMSDGKEMKQILSTLVRPGDSVVTTAFGPVDGMDWVRPVDSKILIDCITEDIKLDKAFSSADVKSALDLAAESAGSDPLVITGSLYLVADVLRLHRSARGETPP